MAVIAVDHGQLAVIVTRLAMTARPRPAPLPTAPLRLVRWAAPSLARYRTLFRRVGEPWLWFSRLVLDDGALGAIITDPAVEIYAVVDRAGVEVGMVELDFRALPACAIAYFALVPELTGQQLGRWLMAEALMRAWRKGVDRVWLHTCTLDHPSALNFYRACGFVATERRIETFADPRLSGLINRAAAPQVPLLDAS
ncbi:GNAT family N-acetyltransferase [Sphingomonas sp. 28-63-12]|uniref:GNAT family N-acetyltransferase n=1 Tax=Sphingomonas sp. 28-63-12 TaxID=1970434 RepID=UPI000BCD5C9F|nr:MAG: GNAT family N-acetyltransferase [Sphingomonas sp. 28-63-12]